MKKILFVCALFLTAASSSFAGTGQPTTASVKNDVSATEINLLSDPHRMTVMDKMGRMYTVEYYVLGNGDYYGHFNVPGYGDIYFQSWSGTVKGANDSSQAFLVQNPEIHAQLEAYFASEGQES